jgi:protein arginine kinase
MGTRLRLARNLKGFPFPHRADAVQKKEILSVCGRALSALPSLHQPVCIALGELSELERQLLVERHCMSVDLAKSTVHTALVVDRDTHFACMINEEDHLRLQILQCDVSIRRTWALLNRLDDELEDAVDYAFSSNWGYLTACPTNLGTGLRASVMMHLPGLVLSGLIPVTVRALSEMGVVMRGLFGEQSKSIGHVFQMSNYCTLGEDEESVLTRLESVVDIVIDKERRARSRLLDNHVQLLDPIGRAYGVLCHGYSLTYEEALNLLSFVRLGLSFGIFPRRVARVIEKLWLCVRPAHLQLTLDATLSDAEANVARAKYLRATMTKIPEPIFPKAQG